ncbi:glycosyltransferase [Candidatus Saccharibacteria bacterium]|nr:glycosyltransferase [Candidatus Saccharibacteria bacterium]MBR3233479.1 glycosyltransferase [Candidatus Saccharibacteria bacterium]
MVKLAGLVTLYHPTDKDIQNISSYLDDVDRLYVVDNTENKKTEPRLPDSDKIVYLSRPSNIGVAKALNLGAEKALKDGFSWLLTNDQDTTFPKGVLNKLKKRIDKEDTKKIAIVTPWHKTKLRDPRPEKDDDPHDVMTSGNLVNLKIWKKVGGFKEWFFIDGIDIEYCMNIHKNGYRILRVNSLAIDHNLGDLFYKTFRHKLYLCTNHPPIRRYYIMRNYYYISKLYGDYEPEAAYCMNLVAAQKHNMKGVLLFENKKISKILMYLRGRRDFYKGVRGKYHG